MNQLIEYIGISSCIQTHFFSARATTCRAALNVRLTMQKNSIPKVGTPRRGTGH